MAREARVDQLIAHVKDQIRNLVSMSGSDIHQALGSYLLCNTSTDRAVLVVVALVSEHLHKSVLK